MFGKARLLKTSRRSFSKIAGASIFAGFTSLRSQTVLGLGRATRATKREVSRSVGIFPCQDKFTDGFSTIVQTAGASPPVWAVNARQETIAAFDKRFLFEVIALHDLAPIAEFADTDPRQKFIVYDRIFEPFVPPPCAASISVDAGDIETVAEAISPYLRRCGLLIGADFGDLIGLDPPLRDGEATGIVIRWSSWNTQGVAASLNLRLAEVAEDGFGGGGLMIALAPRSDRPKFGLEDFDNLGN